MQSRIDIEYIKLKEAQAKEIGNWMSLVRAKEKLKYIKINLKMVNLILLAGLMLEFIVFSASVNFIMLIMMVFTLIMGILFNLKCLIEFVFLKKYVLNFYENLEIN